MLDLGICFIFDTFCGLIIGIHCETAYKEVKGSGLFLVFDKNKHGDFEGL